MITVVLATHNGTRTLPLALESFARIQPPADGWKLIVVDNASTDDTGALLESHRDTLPLTILHHPEPGKNKALNAAVPQFEGDLIVFTDDDVLAPPDWLLAYEALAADRPDCTLFGGKIIPHWPGPVPTAILKSSVPLDVAFAVHDDDMPEGPVNPGMIWGPNMAVRHSVFESGMRFNEGVGPAQGNYIMGSETEFNHRLVNAGHRQWYCPDIIVEHQIRPEQLTAEWLRGRARKFARNTVYQVKVQARANGEPIPKAMPRWRFRQIMESAWRWLTGWLLHNKARQLSGLWYFTYQRAIVRELRRP